MRPNRNNGDDSWMKGARKKTSKPVKSKVCMYLYFKWEIQHKCQCGTKPKYISYKVDGNYIDT